MRSRPRSSALALLTLFALTALVACSRSWAASSSESAAVVSSSAAAAPQTSIQALKLTYGRPTVGAEVRVAASGLPAGKTVDLTWQTATGGWIVEDYYHFRGKKYTASTMSLGRFPIDANGRLEARFDIPEDYGGVHDVIALIDDKPVQAPLYDFDEFSRLIGFEEVWDFEKKYAALEAD